MMVSLSWDRKVAIVPEIRTFFELNHKGSFVPQVEITDSNFQVN